MQTLHTHPSPCSLSGVSGLTRRAWTWRSVSPPITPCFKPRDVVHAVSMNTNHLGWQPDHSRTTTLSHHPAHFHTSSKLETIFWNMMGFGALSKSPGSWTANSFVAFVPNLAWHVTATPSTFDTIRSKAPVWCPCCPQISCPPHVCSHEKDNLPRLCILRNPEGMATLVGHQTLSKNYISIPTIIRHSMVAKVMNHFPPSDLHFPKSL